MASKATFKLEGNTYEVVTFSTKTSKTVDHSNRASGLPTNYTLTVTVHGTEQANTLLENFFNSHKFLSGELKIVDPATDKEISCKKYDKCSITHHESYFNSQDPLPYTHTIILSPGKVDVAGASHTYHDTGHKA